MAKNFKQPPLVLALGAVVSATSVFTLASRSGADAAAAPRQGNGAAVAMVGPEQAQLQHAGVLAAAGRSAIQYAAAARRALADTQLAQARQYLEASKELLAQISEALDNSGNARFDDEGKDGHVVPLYARLGLEEGVTLSDAQKRTLDALAPLVARGEHAAVEQQLRGTGLAIAYSYAEMPLEETAAQIEGALEALDSGETERAQALATAAKEGVVSQIVTVRVGEGDSAPDATPAGDAAAAQYEPAQG